MHNLSLIFPPSSLVILKEHCFDSKLSGYLQFNECLDKFTYVLKGIQAYKSPHELLGGGCCAFHYWLQCAVEFFGPKCDYGKNSFQTIRLLYSQEFTQGLGAICPDGLSSITQCQRNAQIANLTNWIDTVFRGFDVGEQKETPILVYLDMLAGLDN